jgi:hypothetical protein
MEKKNSSGKDLDPQALIDSFREDDPTPRYPLREEQSLPSETESVASEPMKEEAVLTKPATEIVRKPSRHKREADTADYKTLFLSRDVDLSGEARKMVYVSPAMHDKFKKVVHLIGNDKVSLTAYLNNILEHHYAQFEDELNRLILKSLEDYLI